MAGGFTTGNDSSPEYGSAASAISEQLRDIASAGGSGGQFAFSPEQMQEIIKGWNELAFSYTRDLEAAQVMIRVRPPGQDVPSEIFTGVVQSSGYALLESLRREQELCQLQADRFAAALAAHLGNERSTTSEFDQRDPGTVL